MNSTQDPIVEEIRKYRRAHAAKFNYNMDAIYRDLKRGEAKNRRSIVSRPAKPHLKATGS